MNYDPITRTEAIHAISGHIADRTAFVLIAPPSLTGTLGERLAKVGNWTCYLDNGTEQVLQVTEPQILNGALTISDVLGLPVIGVFTIPKTVPAAKLSVAVEQEVPADGSQDLLVVHETTGALAWPELFLAALHRVDPRAANTIRASAIQNQS